VSVTFTGRILGGTLKVTGPRGRVVSIGRGGRDPRNASRLTVSLTRSLAAGRYTVSWAMTAGDGHGQRGSYRFRVGGAT
jgi:methionine-rich copper-binding protein CopC